MSNNTWQNNPLSSSSGDSILVHPVTDAGASQVSVYLPGTEEVWFDRDTHEAFTQKGSVTIPVSISKVSHSNIFIFGDFLTHSCVFG